MRGAGAIVAAQNMKPRARRFAWSRSQGAHGGLAHYLEARMQHMHCAVRTLCGWHITHSMVGCSFTEHWYWGVQLRAACILATLEAMQQE